MCMKYIYCLILNILNILHIQKLPVLVKWIVKYEHVIEVMHKIYQFIDLYTLSLLLS